MTYIYQTPNQKPETMSTSKLNNISEILSIKILRNYRNQEILT